MLDYEICGVDIETTYCLDKNSLQAKIYYFMKLSTPKDIGDDCYAISFLFNGINSV